MFCYIFRFKDNKTYILKNKMTSFGTPKSFYESIDKCKNDINI